MASDTKTYLCFDVTVGPPLTLKKSGKHIKVSACVLNLYKGCEPMLCQIRCS